jgi:2,5-diketo-D-gluconate reductase A
LSAGPTLLVPAVNQIEAHPYFANAAVRRYGTRHGIVTEAWSPIARGKVLNDRVVARIAEATGRIGPNPDTFDLIPD